LSKRMEKSPGRNSGLHHRSSTCTHAVNMNNCMSMQNTQIAQL
jgi:hypothetical protein